MSTLPNGWKKTSLANVLTQIIGGGTPSKNVPHNFDGSIPFMTVKDMKCRFPKDTIDHISEAAVKSSATTMVPRDSLVVATRMSLGKIVRPKCAVAINQDLKVLVPAIGLEKTYLEYFWRSKAKLIDELGTGTTVKGIRLEDIKNLELPLAPISEQRRITDKLDATLTRVDACRERLARVAPILKRFRQSVLAAATSGKLTRDWREQQDNNTADISNTQLQGNTQIGRGSDHLPHGIGKQSADTYSTSAARVCALIQTAKREWLSVNSSHNEAGRIQKRIENFKPHTKGQEGFPSGWNWSALEDTVLMVVDCHNKTAPYEETGIPLVRTSNIRDGRFVWEDLRYVSQKTFQIWSKRCIPEPGDLVFTREAPMGEVAIIPQGAQICLGQRTMLIRPIESICSARYIQLVIMDPNFKARSDSIAVGTGVKHYRVGDVSELLIPLPPVAEQTEIVRRVETLFAFADRLEARLASATTAAERLTPSLLAKAFRGELVPQDPNDEPASELLKRLAVQREAAPKTKRVKKAADSDG